MNLAKSPSGFDMCRRLLVVDDDPDLGELLSLVAQRSGYEVMVTTDYATFTDQYTDDIDVVVVDLVMPDLDGVDVIRFLADRQSKAGVIVASGVDKRVLRTAERLALDRGLRVLGSLSKPFPLADLRQLLTETVGTEAAPSPAAGPHLGTREIRKSLADEEFFLTFPAEDRGRVAVAERRAGCSGVGCGGGAEFTRRCRARPGAWRRCCTWPMASLAGGPCGSGCP